MERTRATGEPTAEVKIRYRKVGGGSLRLAKRLIKPNEIFYAYPSEIPKAFRDTVVPLDGEPPQVDPAEAPLPAPAAKSTYTIQPRGKSKTWFDIVDSQGKVVNEKALSRAFAEQFKRDLER